MELPTQLAPDLDSGRQWGSKASARRTFYVRPSGSWPAPLSVIEIPATSNHVQYRDGAPLQLSDACVLTESPNRRIVVESRFYVPPNLLQPNPPTRLARAQSSQPRGAAVVGLCLEHTSQSGSCSGRLRSGRGERGHRVFTPACSEFDGREARLRGNGQ